MKKQLTRHKQGKKKKNNQVAILLRAQLSVLMDQLVIHNEMGKPG